MVYLESDQKSFSGTTRELFAELEQAPIPEWICLLVYRNVVIRDFINYFLPPNKVNERNITVNL